eukprot:gene15352-18211_t
MFPDYLLVTTKCSVASYLFQAEFAIYRHSVFQMDKVRAVGQISMPTWMTDHVDFVSGLTEFNDKPPTLSRSAMAEDPTTTQIDPNDLPITPDILRRYYNVPETSTITHPANSQAIVSFENHFSVGALLDFGSFKRAMAKFSDANHACNLMEEIDTYDTLHLYSECKCQDLIEYSDNAYRIKGYQMSESIPIFIAEYPSSSPYVLSIGATRFGWQNGTAVYEYAASTQNGSKITTGKN